MNPTAFEHVNRKGQRYFLCQTKSNTNAPRYVFSRKPTGAPVAAVPDGYEVAESVNGLVSLRKTGSCQIRADECALVEAVLAMHHGRRCRVDAKKREIVVHESPDPLFDLDSLVGFFGSGHDLSMRVAASAQLSPVMRFRLIENMARTFTVDRMCFRGSLDGWLPLDTGSLANLAETYIRHIGKDSFFELI
ncbi:MAG: hypothetical protein ACOYOB_18115 [Myxococcota bacterium]